MTTTVIVPADDDVQRITAELNTAESQKAATRDEINTLREERRLADQARREATVGGADPRSYEKRVSQCDREIDRLVRQLADWDAHVGELEIRLRAANSAAADQRYAAARVDEAEKAALVESAMRVVSDELQGYLETARHTHICGRQAGRENAPVETRRQRTVVQFVQTTFRQFFPKDFEVLPQLRTTELCDRLRSVLPPIPKEQVNDGAAFEVAGHPAANAEG